MFGGVDAVETAVLEALILQRWDKAAVGMDGAGLHVAEECILCDIPTLIVRILDSI